MLAKTARHAYAAGTRMSLTIGIVGLPNVGKSTLFTALTKQQVDAANFPFCTIDPNVGCVPVPDERLAELTKIVSPEQTLPTTIEFVDIAGLVRGASEGEGLGNKFLAHIREVDAIAHVLRFFEDGDVTHVDNAVDPSADLATIETELQLADLGMLEKMTNKAEREAKSGDKDLKDRAEALRAFQTALEEGKNASTVTLTDDQEEAAKDVQLLTRKPSFIVANVSEDASDKTPDFDGGNREIVPISAKVESELSELDEEEAKAFLEELGLPEAGLARLSRTSYKTLGLLTFFTAGEKEVRAWTVREGAAAPEAAGVIHTDFEDQFIRAEVIGYQDFVDNQGEKGARESGKMRMEGKDYVLQDGDVCHFHHSA